MLALGEFGEVPRISKCYGPERPSRAAGAAALAAVGPQIARTPAAANALNAAPGLFL
jgi:hypothetical protein